MAAWLSSLDCLWSQSVSSPTPSFTAFLLPSSLSACLFCAPPSHFPGSLMAPPCLCTQPLSPRQHIMSLVWSEPDVRQSLAGSHGHCCCCCCCWTGRGAGLLVPSSGCLLVLHLCLSQPWRGQCSVAAWPVRELQAAGSLFLFLGPLSSRSWQAQRVGRTAFGPDCVALDKSHGFSDSLFCVK